MSGAAMGAGLSGGHHGTTAYQQTSSHSLPTAGLFISDIPMHNPDGSRRLKRELWQDIVKHWMEGNPALGLHTPLRDWPPEWTRGNNCRLFAAKHYQHSLVTPKFLNT